MSSSKSDLTAEESFHHEALFYAGEGDFVARVSGFVRDALAAAEPVLLMIQGEKIRLLREALGRDSDAILMVDMAEIGRNPARVLPAWREFFVEHAAAGRRARGVGELFRADRSSDELVECHRQEAVANLAFTGFPAHLMCPYDTTALDSGVIEHARRTHRYWIEEGVRHPSSQFVAEIPGEFTDPLLDPEGPTDVMEVREGNLTAIRKFVVARANQFGMTSARVDDFVLAVNEVTTNSVRHGGGHGTLRLWQAGEALVCEVRDRGHINDPLAGRVRPVAGQEGGFGLWLCNQLCDLVQIRTFSLGSVVRLHMGLR